MITNTVEDFLTTPPETAQNGRTFESRTLAELLQLARGLQPQKRLLGNYILEDTLSFFAAEAGAGKTYLALQLGLCVAHGIPSLIGERVEVSGGVLYCDFELGFKKIARRLEGLMNVGFPNTEKTANHRFDVICNRGNLLAMIDDVERFVLQNKYVLLMVDNFKAAASLINTDKNSDVSNFMMRLLELKDKTGCALVIIHHLKKGSAAVSSHSDSMSGAGALGDLADSVFFLRKSKQDRDFRLLQRTKSRDVEEPDGAKLLGFRKNPNDMWFYGIDDDVNEDAHLNQENAPPFRLKNQDKFQAAQDLRKEGKNYDEISAKLNVSKSTVSRWFSSVPFSLPKGDETEQNNGTNNGTVETVNIFNDLEGFSEERIDF